MSVSKTGNERFLRALCIRLLEGRRVPAVRLPSPLQAGAPGPPVDEDRRPCRNEWRNAGGPGQTCDRKTANLPMTWELELTAMLSHIGCMALPRTVLDKLASGQDLAPDEQPLYDSHPAVGAGLLEHIPRLQRVSEMIGRQHAPGGPLEPDEQLQGCYDPGLLAAFEQAVGKDAGYILRRVALVDLQEYMVLEEGIATEQGLLLLAKGTEMSAAGIQRIIQARSDFTIIEPVLVRVPR